MNTNCCMFKFIVTEYNTDSNLPDKSAVTHLQALNVVKPQVEGISVGKCIQAVAGNTDQAL